MLVRNSFYTLPLFLTAIAFGLLLGSCSKTTTIEPGISYGVTGFDPEMAASGDTVSIFGAGFSADTSGNTVTINGSAAHVVAASASLLKIIVPVGAGRGSVQVKTGSKSSTGSDQFTLATVVSGNQTASAAWTP